MKDEFRDNIEFGRFDGAYPSYTETALTKLCNNHQVDFEAILENLENPYK